MGKLIYLGGVRGVGKSTLAAELAKRLPKAETFEVGTALRREARKRFHTSFTALAPEQLQTLGARVARQIQRKQKTTKHLIVVDHYAFLPAGTGDVFREGPVKPHILPKVNHLVLIDATAEEIARRRLIASKVRPKDPQTLRREILAHQLVAHAVARESGKPLTIITNADGKKEAALLRLKTLVMGKR